MSGVKLGEKCTVMMYGPTGSGKSYTMFGCAKESGIVYRALRDIMGEDGVGCFVQVSVLEIYNEEIYDLLSNTKEGGFGFGWQKGSASKVRLEVMGKKAKNATFLSGNEAGKLSREVAKVEKRRIIKSTLSNERSSRSHCMIILDVPTVGGRLMLVDMAGSENIEQAGQVGFEAKMQTAKINQGNIALKRVVESIANGDSHVPFRDSKLTMLLQDSFEDDKSKILMILCASPDSKEMHKTISTLEYGAKAKCIVRGSQTPSKDNASCENSSSAVILGSRIAAMDDYINKLQMESNRREKERDDAHKELMKKEEEVAALRAKLEIMERRTPLDSEEEINLKVKEREQILKIELEKKLQECQKMAEDFVEMGRSKMEEKILQQQQELEILRQRLVELESELRSRGKAGDYRPQVREGTGTARRMMEMFADQGMEKSMDLDMGDHEPKVVHVVKEMDNNMTAPNVIEKGFLSTVYEGDEEKENIKDKMEETVTEYSVRVANDVLGFNGRYEKPDCYSVENLEKKGAGHGLLDKLENAKDPVSDRRTRIQNIFLLCGNHRELAQHMRGPSSGKRKLESAGVCSFPEVSPIKDSLVKQTSPLQTAPGHELGHMRRVLSDVTSRNIMISPISGLNMVENSIESPLKRSRTSTETAQHLKENISPC